MKQTILDLIAANPNIRTVEISDRLDIDLEMVRPHIADEIRSGEIVEEPILAPNGRTVLSFRRADAAPKVAVVTSPVEASAALPARVVRAMPPAVRKMLAPPQAAPAPDAKAESSVPLEIDVPVTRKEGVPLVPPTAAVPVRAPTKIELALECLRAANGAPVPTEVLARAMGLPEKHHPTSYLRLPMRDGRISTRAKMWRLGPADQAPAAVELPAPVVSVRPKLSEMAPAPQEFPRADPAALAAYVPGSKRCAMNCSAHADDPRSAAERALLCDDCEQVARLEETLAESAQAPAAIEPAAATEAEWVGRAEADEQVEFTPPVVADEPSTAAAWVAAADDLPVESLPSIVGGLPVLTRPFAPVEAEPGIDALDFSRNGVYENGVFRKPMTSTPIAIPVFASETEPLRTPSAARDAKAERFLAGVMSDGSLHLRIPGREPLDIEPEHARALWEFVKTHGYAAWATT